MRAPTLRQLHRPGRDNPAAHGPGAPGAGLPEGMVERPLRPAAERCLAVVLRRDKLRDHGLRVCLEELAAVHLSRARRRRGVESPTSRALLHGCGGVPQLGPLLREFGV